MNTKLKKGMFWGGIIASMILVMNVFHYLFGGIHALAGGPYGGHGPKGMNAHHGFGPNQMMAHHYYGGFPWMGFLLFLIIGIIVLILVVKWVRKKAKASAMQTFIDTSLMSSQSSLSNQSANVLDQWEKNLLNKKENI